VGFVADGAAAGFTVKLTVNSWTPPGLLTVSVTLIFME
jgi:hypothetical protein